MGAPSYNAPAMDPATVAAEKQAQSEMVQGLQETDRGDMGSLMAAYGTLAMGLGTNGGLGGSAGAKAVVGAKA